MPNVFHVVICSVQLGDYLPKWKESKRGKLTPGRCSVTVVTGRGGGGLRVCSGTACVRGLERQEAST
jgi:hypothetical protein